jgi:hypothetical protein
MKMVGYFRGQSIFFPKDNFDGFQVYNDSGNNINYY